jgi:hypothetical protein
MLVASQFERSQLSVRAESIVSSSGVENEINISKKNARRQSVRAESIVSSSGVENEINIGKKNACRQSVRAESRNSEIKQ